MNDDAFSDSQAFRDEMIETQCRQRGVRDARVLSAMRTIPRELFVPAGAVERAYEDCALPLALDQTISQPFMVARMTELLQPGGAETVLEVGTGSGYQTAILARLAKHVFTIEWHATLMEAAAERLARLRIGNVTFRCGDGSLGWPEHAPFGGIIVTAGGPVVPPALPEQLGESGRLVMPVGPIEDQTLVLVLRRDGGLTRSDVLKCRFVKLLGAAGWRA